MPKIRAYLLKDNITEFADAMRGDDSETLAPSLPLRDNTQVDGVIHFPEPRQKPPAWLGFLSEGLQNPPEFRVASASAVFLLRTRGRIFALTFGYGRTMLNPNACVRDFGVRVAINSIDPDLIKSVDMRRVEEMTIHTRRQVSRASSLVPFRIDERQDFVRSIGGRPIEGLGWSGTVEGADSVAVSLDVAFEELPGLCGQLLDLYESTDYVEHGFGFIDNLRLVTDPDDLQKLHSALDAALGGGDTSALHLSLPDAMDLGDINSYKYRARGQAHDELDVDEMLDELRASDVTVTAEWLARHHLQVNYAGSPETDYARCPLFDTLVFETRLHDDAVYVLSAGEWHRVGDTLVCEVDEKLAALQQCSLTLPCCGEGWTEGHYNQEASDSLGYACMDARNISFGGHDRIEFCDLFGGEGRFIHVKKRSKSSTLSHLFLQGLNSARLFLGSPEFRGCARAKVAEVSSVHACLIPEASPDTRQYEVVFGIIGKPHTQDPASLPFFSRLSMAETTDSIRELGYKVSYATIDYSATG